MIYLLALPLAILAGGASAYWRRIFGGSKEGQFLGNRGVQAVLMCLFTLGVVYPYSDSNWWSITIALGVTALLYGQYWSRGHGCCFDEGRGTVDETLIKRYNERWYHKPLDWLLPNAKYGFLYDFLYMQLRYTMPLLPLMIIDWRYILIGLFVSPIYAFCWTLFEREPWLSENSLLVKMKANYSTALAEYVVGFIYGFILVLINMI